MEILNIPKDLMEVDMKELGFVNWDRFIVNNEQGTVFLYGWIDRKNDSYKDFVFLEYKDKGDNSWDTSFATSSRKYSLDIHRIMEAKGKHNDCTRVEDHFSLINIVRKLSSKPEKEWFKSKLKINYLKIYQLNK